MGKGKGGGGVPFLNSFNDVGNLVRLQEEANRRAAETSARYNYFDTITPFGSRRFEGRPGQPGFTQIEELPEAEREYLERSRQYRLDLQGLGEQQFGQLGDIFGSPISGGQEAAAELEKATFDRGRNLLQPGFDETRRRLENSLIQRGIPRGSAAYIEAIRDLNQNQGTALENLALSSVQAGRQEQSRQLQSDLARRSGIINELSTLGMGSPSAPAFQATPSIGIGPSDVMGSASTVGQGIAGQQASRQAAKAAGKGGATQLGSAALLAYGGKPGAPKGGGGAQLGSQFSPFGFGVV